MWSGTWRDPITRTEWGRGGQATASSLASGWGRLTCGLRALPVPSLVQTWGGADLLQEGDGAWAGSGGEERGQALTWSFQVLAELGLGLAVGPEAALLRELVGHGGGGDDGFEAALALGHVLLRVEEDDVDLGHVEHPQGHRGAQTHRDRQRRRLDVQLGAGRGRCQGGLRPGLSGALSEAHALDRHSWVQTRGPPCVPLAEGSCGIELGL